MIKKIRMNVLWISSIFPLWQSVNVACVWKYMTFKNFFPGFVESTVVDNGFVFSEAWVWFPKDTLRGLFQEELREESSYVTNQLDHIPSGDLSGEVGLSCNFYNWEHDLLVTGWGHDYSQIWWAAISHDSHERLTSASSRESPKQLLLRLLPFSVYPTTTNHYYPSCSKI